ncbi:MAG: metallophosphoesterase, partial [Polyangiaceae bacterium]|nr:metallophosphoesterase [Polyangiaceae bacterium]
GDNFYDHGVADLSDEQWVTKFEQPYDRQGLNGLPFYAVLGNHDYGLTSNGVKQAQIDYSSLPVGNGPGTRFSDKWTMPASYYDVQIGHVHLFGIDTQDFTGSDQADDMSARVASSTATWKIVFGHHPRYTSGDHYFDDQVLGFLGMFSLQEAVYCGADMFMAGHDHDRELIDKGRDGDCPDTHFVISGAGAKLRETMAIVPTDEGQLYFDDVTEGFAYMEFNGTTLLFEFIDKNGVVNFTKTITK